MNFEPKEKWGEKLIERGFCIIPDDIIKRWSSTGLDATDLAIVTTLSAYWWSAEKLPHPSTATLAKNLSVSKRTIERRIKNMAQLGYLSRGKKVEQIGGPVTREFDLSKIIKKFEAM